MSHDKVWPEYPHEPGEKNNASADVASVPSIKFETLLKQADDVALPESGVYFDALEARIMGALDAAIEAGEVENRETVKRQAIEMYADSPVTAAVKSSTKLPSSVKSAAIQAQIMKGRRSITLRAGQFALLVGAALMTSGKLHVAATLEDLIPDSILTTEGGDDSMLASRGSAAQEIRATQAAAPKVLTDSVIGFESETDLAIEIAARRMVAYHQGK